MRCTRLLGGEGACELECLLPMKKISAHLKCGEGAGGLEEVILRAGMVIKDEGKVAGE